MRFCRVPIVVLPLCTTFAENEALNQFILSISMYFPFLWAFSRVFQFGWIEIDFEIRKS